MELLLFGHRQARSLLFCRCMPIESLLRGQDLLGKVRGDSTMDGIEALRLRVNSRTKTARRAVAAVLNAECVLGRIPREMPHSNPGYDIESLCRDGRVVFIEVKGHILGSDTFWVSRTEALHSKNAGDGSRLAMVSVSPRGSEFDKVRYIVDPFRDTDFGDFNATGIIGSWSKEWERGTNPL
jgi:hypothetical protein